LAVDDADLVIFYGGEQDGNIGTCGCERNPRGSLGRVHGYVQASRRANPQTPTLLVNAGGFLTRLYGEGPSLRADSVVANRWMIRALEEGGWDALNLAYPEMPWLTDHDPPTNGITASYAHEELRPWRLVNAGSLTVGVTGVSVDGASYMRRSDIAYVEPIDALRQAIGAMEEAGADLVVVLGYGIGRLADRIASLDGVDVLIEAGEFKGRFAPWFEDGTVWVRVRHQTQCLGELRLFISQHKQVIAARDRMIDMDREIGSSRASRRLARAATADIEAALDQVFGRN